MCRDPKISAAAQTTAGVQTTVTARTPSHRYSNNCHFMNTHAHMCIAAVQKHLGPAHALMGQALVAPKMEHRFKGPFTAAVAAPCPAPHVAWTSMPHLPDPHAATVLAKGLSAEAQPPLSRTRQARLPVRGHAQDLKRATSAAAHGWAVACSHAASLLSCGLASHRYIWDAPGHPQRTRGAQWR